MKQQEEKITWYGPDVSPIRKDEDTPYLVKAKGFGGTFVALCGECGDEQCGEECEADRPWHFYDDVDAYHPHEVIAWTLLPQFHNWRKG